MSMGSSCQWSLVLTVTFVAAVLMLQYFLHLKFEVLGQRDRTRSLLEEAMVLLPPSQMPPMDPPLLLREPTDRRRLPLLSIDHI